MQYYQTVVTFHILFAGIWLINLLFDFSTRGIILNSKIPAVKKSTVSLYLNFVNLVGMIGAVGILVTGIVMVILNPSYSFFDPSANHWLLTKQIIMIIILAVLFIKLIPAAKKVRKEISSLDENSIAENLSIKKLFSINNFINLLVVINLLLALSHRFIG